MSKIEITINAKSAVPVYEQIKRSIKLGIINGLLEQGEKMVSIRELALKLKTNPNTIQKVYYQLEVEGYLYSKPGSGYFVRLKKDNLDDEKVRMFKTITDEYINKVTELGFSIEKIISYMNDREDKTKK